MKPYAPRVYRKRDGWGWVSPKERQKVLRLKSWGSSNKEIVNETGLSYTTVLNIIKSEKVIHLTGCCKK